MIEFLLIACVLLPVAAAPVAYALRRYKSSVSDGFTSLVCLLCLIFTVAIACVAPTRIGVEGPFLMGISLSSGGVQTVFGVLCAAMFFMSSLANPAYFHGRPRTERYRAFLLLTLGATMGVFFAGDLLTLYVCFETMSLASWVWIAHDENPQTEKAADTYLAMGMIGGLVMLYGLFLLNHRFGTLAISELQKHAGEEGLMVPGLCLLVGFGIKAGMFPLHVWLPKAYPAAPAPASALLSSILSKAGIYGVLLIIVCLLWKNAEFMLLLLILGTITMVLGALLAVFSVNLKRTLACSSLSQIGFILVGAAVLTLGEEVSLAGAGLMTHAVNHALTKLVLFLAAGVLFRQMHTLDLNDLKGAGHGSWPLMICFLIGGVSLAGVPGFGGYISKTLLHESIVHQIHLQSGMLAGILSSVETLFLISGGLTLAYMTKLFVKIFVQKPDAEGHTVKADKLTLIAIVPAAAALLVMGLLPGLTYEKITSFTAGALRCEPVHVAYFTLENLKGAGISILIGAAVYFLFIRGLLTNRQDGAYQKATTLLDLEDDVYRPLLNGLSFLGALAARLCYTLTDLVVTGTRRLIYLGAHDRVDPGRDHHFTHYSKQYVKFNPIKQTLQFELLLFGVGVVIVLVYLLIAM